MPIDVRPEKKGGKKSSTRLKFFGNKLLEAVL